MSPCCVLAPLGYCTHDFILVMGQSRSLLVGTLWGFHKGAGLETQHVPLSAGCRPVRARAVPWPGVGVARPYTLRVAVLSPAHTGA